MAKNHHRHDNDNCPWNCDAGEPGSAGLGCNCGPDAYEEIKVVMDGLFREWMRKESEAIQAATGMSQQQIDSLSLKWVNGNCSHAK